MNPQSAIRKPGSLGGRTPISAIRKGMQQGRARNGRVTGYAGSVIPLFRQAKRNGSELPPGALLLPDGLQRLGIVSGRYAGLLQLTRRARAGVGAASQTRAGG